MGKGSSRTRGPEERSVPVRGRLRSRGLPEEPGVILIRGHGRYGKSTWLEGQLVETVRRFGRGSAFYLNGG